MKTVFNNIGKGFTWMILTILFGLLQLWLVLGRNLVVRKDILTYETIILDGVLLFFITAIVTTISVDYFHSNMNFSKRVVGFLFVLYPLLIILSSVSLFYMMLENSMDDLDFKTIESFQYALITMTVIYAISTKAFKFHHDK
ncbi:hypothetical protein ACJD0Z_04595 [Flavobacteriaceae bacterium M23B6Z8]